MPAIFDLHQVQWFCHRPTAPPAAMMRWTSLSVLKTLPFSMAFALTFWVLAGLSFFRVNGLRPNLDFGPLHASKLVGGAN